MTVPALPCDPALGVVRDYAFFHQDTCDLPSDALLYTFLEVAAVAGVLAARCVYRLRTARKDAKSLLLDTLLVLLSSFLMAIGLYLQDVVYEVALIGLIMNITVTSHLAKLVLSLALKPAS